MAAGGAALATVAVASPPPAAGRPNSVSSIARAEYLSPPPLGGATGFEVNAANELEAVGVDALGEFGKADVGWRGCEATDVKAATSIALISSSRHRHRL